MSHRCSQRIALGRANDMVSVWKGMPSAKCLQIINIHSGCDQLITIINSLADRRGQLTCTVQP